MSRNMIAILICLGISFSGLRAQVSDILLDAYGYYYSGDYSRALEAFKKLNSESSTPRPVDLVYKGISEYYLGNYSNALSDFIAASEKNIPQAYLWIARTDIFLDNQSEALLYLKKYLRLTPGYKIEDIRKDPLFKPLHNTDGWYNLLQNNWQNEIQEILDEANFLSEKQRYTEVHSLIEKNSHNKDIRLIEYNSKIYAAEGNIELAINELNQGLSVHPENELLLKEKADYLIQLSKYNEAFEILTELLKATPEDFPLRYSHAEAAYKSRNLSVAKNDIDLYLRYFSKEEAVLLAGKIDYASGKYLEALRYFNKLLKNNTSNAEYFKFRGLTYYQTHTLKQAAYDLSMSLDLVPDDAETNYYLGMTYNLMGNKRMACYYLNRAMVYGDLKANEYIQENCNK